MMKNILQILSLVICIGCFLVPVQTVTGAAKDTVKIAILPCSDIVKTFERFKPLVTLIEDHTGYTVQTVFPKNEDELLNLFRKRNTDFIFHSPYGFSDIKKHIDSQSLLKALSLNGEDYEIGYLVVRKDSGIKTIQDLKGKSVLFGMECSASRWVVARKIFKDNNIDIDKDLGSYADGGCCEDISFNVFLKAADAGLVCQHYIDEQKKIGAKHIVALNIIEQSAPSPTRIFAAHKNTSQGKISKVTEALLSIDVTIPEYRSLVETTEIGGFARALPTEYESLRYVY